MLFALSRTRQGCHRRAGATGNIVHVLQQGAQRLCIQDVLAEQGDGHVGLRARDAGGLKRIALLWTRNA